MRGGLGRHPAEQIGQVECVRGMRQEMGSVPEPPRVFKIKGVPAVAYGPVLALFAEDPFLRRTNAQDRLARSSAMSIRCHLNFLRNRIATDRTILVNLNPPTSWIFLFTAELVISRNM